MSDQEGQRVLCVITHRGPKTADVGLLCRHHHEQLETRLSELLDMWALRPALSVMVTPDSDEREERATKKPFHAAPIRLDVLALSDERNTAVGSLGLTYERNWNGHRLESNGPDIPDVPGVLAEWCRLVAEERNLAGRWEPNVSSEVRFLTTHLDWICYQPWVDEMFEEIRVCRRSVAYSVGHQDPKPIGECPVIYEEGVCGGSLWQDQGSVRCSACRETWSGMELVRLRLLRVDEAETA